MMRRKTLVAVALVAMLVLVAAGCGTGGLGDRKADKALGKELFASKCAACHVLADAGAVGISGPNLDHAFAEVRKQGFQESTIFEVIDKQIKYPTPRALKDPQREIHVNGPLPTVQMEPDIVKGGDREAVAAYVASVAGLPVKGGGGKIVSTDGKELFAQAGCGSCHAFKDAGSTGAIGPNLDATMPSRDVVVQRVTNGKGAMPSFKGKLDDDQIGAVADYVSGAAGS